MPSHTLCYGKKKVSGIGSASAREGRSFFSNRNSALHSIEFMVSRSNSSYSLYGKQGFLEAFCSHKRANYSSSIVPSPWATSSSSLAFANDAMFLLYLRSDVLFENWRKVAVAVLLNMPSRLQRDVGLAPAFTRICRRRRPLPSWCLKSLFCSGQVAVVAVCVGSHCAPCVGDRYCRLSNDKKFKKNYQIKTWLQFSHWTSSTMSMSTLSMVTKLSCCWRILMVSAIISRQKMSTRTTCKRIKTSLILLTSL